MLGGGRCGVLAAGRLAVRAVLSAGVVDAAATCSELPAPFTRAFVTTAQCKEATPSGSKSYTPECLHSRVHTAQCGFGKNMVGGPSRVNEKGVYGEDACFISMHKSTCVVGVADGVGGWRNYGIDPSAFSSKLMRECEKIVEKGDFEPSDPKRILDNAFAAMREPPKPIGSSTACILVVHQSMLYSANLGDSGFVVIRGGKVLARSEEQVHYFNAPFQLALPPEGMRGNLGDTPDKADQEKIPLEKGDIIVLATDGLWDNVPEKVLLNQLENLKDPASITEACNSLALTARRLAFDQSHQSPFAMKAREHGYNFPGGKPDDITLVLILIE